MIGKDFSGTFSRKTGVPVNVSVGKSIAHAKQEFSGSPLFFEALQQELQSAALRTDSQGGTTAVLFVRLDGSVRVSNSLHAQAEERIAGLLRADDLVTDAGCGAFLIALQNLSDETQAALVADRIVRAFQRPFLAGDSRPVLEADIGCAVYPSDGVTGKELAEKAKAQLCRKDRNSAFSRTNPAAEPQEDRRLTNKLNRALGRDEFELYYQPQIDMLSGRVVGLEALIRWNDPEYGVTNPDRFIPLAEKNRLICQIGDWVIRTACSQHRIWREKGLIDCPISVNLSACQFTEPELTDRIADILKETGLPARYLTLEVTESISIKDIAAVIQILGKLKDSGVGIVIDDFGTAYASLNYLRQLPADAIKIDRSFVKGIGSSAKDEAIIQAVIMLIRNLGMDVVAEGVETQQQADFLEAHECHIAQGFFYGRPMPRVAFEDYLTRQ